MRRPSSSNAIDGRSLTRSRPRPLCPRRVDLHLAAQQDVDAGAPLELRVERLVRRRVHDEGGVALPQAARSTSAESRSDGSRRPGREAGARPPRGEGAGGVAGGGHHPSPAQERPGELRVDLARGGEAAGERAGRLRVVGGQAREGRPRGGAQDVQRPVDLARHHPRGGEPQEEDDGDPHEERQEDDRDEGDEEVGDDELGPDAPEQALRGPAVGAPGEPAGEQQRTSPPAPIAPGSPTRRARAGRRGAAGPGRRRRPGRARWRRRSGAPGPGARGPGRGVPRGASGGIRVPNLAPPRVR
jgi:hypothetical protein